MNKFNSLIAVATLVLSANIASAQCCNVVSTNGVNAITANGICVITKDALGGDCTDTDGDGVIDKNDNCPTVKGLAGLAGCPDGDSDGIVDAEDACPTKAGILANKGCPAISEEVKATLLSAAHIQFATGSDVILAESYPNLDAVVAIMNSNPAYKLDLAGYTDNTGDAAFNVDLSKKRAAAAKVYLINKGVAASKISSDGFGSADPVDTNDTAEGRAENRRVEFNIKF